MTLPINKAGEKLLTEFGSEPAERVHHPLCGQVGGVRGIFRRVVPEIGPSSIDLNLSPPLAFGEAHAQSSRGPATRPLDILLILGLRGLAQIGNPVVPAHAVDVIQLCRRESAVHVEPRKTMSDVSSIVHLDLNVATAVTVSGDAAGCEVAARSAPRENASVRVVVQKLAQAFWCNGSSHDDSFKVGLVRAHAVFQHCVGSLTLAGAP